MLVTVERILSPQKTTTNVNSCSQKSEKLYEYSFINHVPKLLLTHQIKAYSKSVGHKVYETFLTVNGAAIKIPNSQSLPKSVNIHMGDIESHLKDILNLLRDEDSLKLAVRLDSNFTSYDYSKHHEYCNAAHQADSPHEILNLDHLHKTRSKFQTKVPSSRVRYLAIISNPNITQPYTPNIPTASKVVYESEEALRYLILGIDGIISHPKRGLKERSNELVQNHGRDLIDTPPSTTSSKQNFQTGGDEEGHDTTGTCGIKLGSKFTIGLVLPFEPRKAHVSLDGDGGLLIDTIEEDVIDLPQFPLQNSPTEVPQTRIPKQHHHYFKPISVQAMWAAVQSLHKILYEKVTSVKLLNPPPIPLEGKTDGKIHYNDWLTFYRLGGNGAALTTDPLAFREWHTLAPTDESSSSKLFYDLALEPTANPSTSPFFFHSFFGLNQHENIGLEQNFGIMENSEIKEQKLGGMHCYNPKLEDAVSDTHKAKTVCFNIFGEEINYWRKLGARRQAIKQNLKEIMMTVHLDDATCKFIRGRLESSLGFILNPSLKSFVDEQIMIILGQMELSTKIFDYLYLGSEWNASNLDELRSNG